jgi:hypothetical protein
MSLAVLSWRDVFSGARSFVPRGMRPCIKEVSSGVASVQSSRAAVIKDFMFAIKFGKKAQI